MQRQYPISVEDTATRADPAPLPPPALQEVYKAHAQQVGRWAARLAGPTLDAEDLIHEVFLVVQAELPRFRGTERLAGWLYRITLNVVRDRRRKERRRWFRNLRFGWASPADPVTTMVTPYDDVAQREVTERVYAVLEELGERDRALLVLSELEGYEGQHIAELLDVKVETLWVQLHRARAKFRDRFEARYGELRPASTKGLS